MPSPQEQISQLQAAIAAQESLRPTLGDAVVDTTITALRAQLNSLLEQQASAAQPASPASVSPEQLLARLLPRELADKIRATGHIEGERKQVTVMFADISGFTALSERLDPEIIREFQNELFPELAAAVYQYEGYIDKFIGDAIMAVFGAPVAHEDDPERALRSALDMRARVEQLNRQWAEQLGAPLSLHIGINTGTVVAGEIGANLGFSYTVTGDTVNTASRLEVVALPGQILVSRETYRLTQGAFEFVALEPIRVKGKREPIAVFELQRAKLNPLKARGLKDLGSAYVERAREMAQLRGVLQDLAADRGCIVMVSGEAGIGKSRLMAEWRNEIGERARWREGRAFAHTTGLAYGPFLDLFRRYANIQDDATEAEARAVLHRAVSRFFGDNLEAHALFANLFAMRLSPEEAAVIATMPAQIIRQKLFAYIAQGIEEPTRRHPTVLVLEDTHWADSTSLALVEYLLPITERVPLAIVCIFRWHPDEPAVKLLSMVQSHYADRALHIALAPLSESSSVTMVEQLLSSRELPDRLKRLILQKAEGNPFFVEEVIRMLIDRGALMRADKDDSGELCWVATPLIESVTVPNTLEGVLMSRLDRLPAETKWIAQQASVIGRIFLYRVLLQMSVNTSIDNDLSYLERQELIRARARDPEIEYIFKHALTQEVAYQSLLAPRRKELHRKVGEAMESVFAERVSEFSSIIGAHFLKGEAWEKAALYLIQAGDAAARLFSHAEARQHYARALDALNQLPDSEEQRRRMVDTMVKLVSVSIVADDPGLNIERLQKVEPIAQQLPAPDGTGTGDRLRLARIHYWLGRSHFYRNESREAIGYYRQVLAVAQEVGDEELLALPSSTLGQVALLIQGQFGQALPLLQQAIAPLEKAEDWTEWIRAMGYYSLACAAQGRYREGIAAVERALARAHETNNLTATGLLHLLTAGICLMGRDNVRVLDAVHACLEVNQKTGDRLQAYIAYGLRAWAQSRLGRHADAADSMSQSQAIAQNLGGRLVLADWFAAARAELALNADHNEEALKLAEEAVNFAQTVGSVYSVGLARRSWGEALAALNPPCVDDAEAQMALSVQALESGAALLEAAHTHFAWGQLCLDWNDGTGAREHFVRAAAQFDASDLRVLSARAQALSPHVA